MYPNNGMMNQAPNQNYYTADGQMYQQGVPMQQQVYPMQSNSPYQYGMPQNQYPQAQPYYGQQAAYQPQLIEMGNMMEQRTNVIVVEQPRADDGEHLPSQVKSKQSREIKCAVCRRRGWTNTKTVIGAGSWTIGLALFCCGCWPCACIPCCVQDCMDVQHKCPNCGAACGTRRYLFDD